jgi:tetratricopeptide (TPR) repeat protein
MARIFERRFPIRGDPNADVNAEPPAQASPMTSALPCHAATTGALDVSPPGPPASRTLDTAENTTVTPKRNVLTARTIYAGAVTLFLAIPAIAKTVSVLLAIALAVFVAHAELIGQRVVIEPFEVASDLRESGFTSRTVANKLTDHLAAIRTTAKTSMRRQQFVPLSSEAAPKVLALGGDISIDAVFQYVREFLGRDPVRIVGEIVTAREARDASPVVQVTTRVKGKPPKTISGPVGRLDAMLLQSAEHIFLHTQPYLLASFLYEVDPKRCLEAIQYVLQNDPPTDDARAFNLWGLLLADAGDSDGAVERFREAVRVSAEPDIRARALTNWAAALRRQAKHQEALEKVQQAVAADPAQADAYHVWGLVLAAKERQSVTPATPSHAAEKFRRAIEVNPRFVPAYFSLAEELERTNELQAAIEQLRKAVDRDRGSSEGRVRLGRALTRAKELGEAKQHLERAVELNPTSFEAHNALGIVLMRQGDFGAAAGQFARAKEASPTESSPYFNLGLIHRMGGDRERAVREFRGYLALAPEGPGADQARKFIAELWGNAPVPGERPAPGLSGGGGHESTSGGKDGVSGSVRANGRRANP